MHHYLFINIAFTIYRTIQNVLNKIPSHKIKLYNNKNIQAISEMFKNIVILTSQFT